MTFPVSNKTLTANIKKVYANAAINFQTICMTFMNNQVILDMFFLTLLQAYLLVGVMYCMGAFPPSFYSWLIISVFGMLAYLTVIHIPTHLEPDYTYTTTPTQLHLHKVLLSSPF